MPKIQTPQNQVKRWINHNYKLLEKKRALRLDQEHDGLNPAALRPAERQALMIKRANRLRRYPSPGESRVYKILNKFKVNFIFQKGFLTEKSFYIVDFYFPKTRLILEIDGFQHNQQDQKHYDYERDKYLIFKKKCKVLRLTHKIALLINPWELRKKLLKISPNLRFNVVEYKKKSGYIPSTKKQKRYILIKRLKSEVENNTRFDCGQR